MTFPQACARSTERHCIHGFNYFFAQELNVCIALRWKLLVCLPAMFSLNHFFFFFFFLRYCKVYEMQATNTLSLILWFICFNFVQSCIHSFFNFLHRLSDSDSQDGRGQLSHRTLGEWQGNTLGLDSYSRWCRWFLPLNMKQEISFFFFIGLWAEVGDPPEKGLNLYFNTQPFYSWTLWELNC